jgi:hypothetical protein
MIRSIVTIAVIAILALTAHDADAQPKGKKGFGKGKGDPAMQADMEVFHFLLDHRKDIKRTVKEIDGGVETVTESDVPAVASKIQEHVAAMHKRIKDGKGIHLRDPLFAEIFKHADRIEMSIDKIDKGVRVRETSKDEYVAKLIRAHASVVTNFIENGHAEMRKDHPLPEKK